MLRVLDAADVSDEHLTAEQIGTRVAEAEPSVHRATVYRTLTSLVEAGVVSHVHLGGSAAVYHLDDERPSAATAHSHAHVQCSTCGRIIDVPHDAFDPSRRGCTTSSASGSTRHTPPCSAPAATAPDSASA